MIHQEVNIESVSTAEFSLTSGVINEVRNVDGRVGQQLSLTAEGEGRRHGLEEIVGVLRSDFVGEDRLDLTLQLLLLLHLSVLLHLGVQRIPLTFGHASELNC